MQAGGGQTMPCSLGSLFPTMQMSNLPLDQLQTL